MENSITLSRSEFKALASESRIEIIKLLQDRNHTLSELSKKLDLAAPTIKQHLAVLEGANLVKGIDEGRKWKYYCLTAKGKNMLKGEEGTNILIVLGATIFGLFAVLYALFSSLVFRLGALQAAEDAFRVGTAGAPAEEAAKEGAAAGIMQGMPLEQIALYVALAVLFAAFLGFLLGRFVKKR